MGGLAFGGLGCASSSDASLALTPDSSSSAADAAAAVRASADWQGKRAPRRRRRRKNKNGYGGAQMPDVADVTDVWCAPGVVFSAEASVDCVVAHRRERAHSHRERPLNARRGGGDEEIMSGLLDCPSSLEMRHFGAGINLRSDRGGYRPSPAEFREMIMFRPRVILGGVNVHDQYKDLRLDVDNMSYEELLELTEKIGYVSTGLREEDIVRNLRKPKHSFFSASPSLKEWKCSICQEEYEVNDDMGRLECGHSFHTYCIKQWLLQKNACPVCKTAIDKS